MKAYPFMDVLSLGHHWQPSKRAASRKAVKSASRESGAADALLTHLQHQRGSCGIHACTLLALRCGSVERLRDALEKGKATHFDQWLFLQQQSVCVFFREPALAGWMDCDITLNPPGKLRKKANHRGEDEGSVPFHDNRHAGTCLGRRGWVPCADVGTTPVLNVRKGKGFVGWNPATTEGTDQRHC